MGRLRLLIASTAILLAFPASLAHASAYSLVLKAYEQDHLIPPCEFSSSQLDSALKGVDTYGAQYFQDFTDAIESTLADQASGTCARTKTSTHPTAASSHAAGPLRLRPVTAATNGGVPLPLVVMASLAAALALLGGAAALAHTRGWDPGWAVAWRHMWDETGYRVGGTWSEFRDWIRLR